MAAAVALESLNAPLIDSHCHIVFRNFDDDLEEVAQRWRDAG
ncbi:MAG: deoxyribonuclease, partial [Synechococcaceae bacterium WB4_1_0192]|nr:deoxyribonuclease [Synechococcaceae bacterium WB4_1_0192]